MTIKLVQSLEGYEKQAEDLAFIKAMTQCLLEIQEGKTLSLDEAKKWLGIE